MRVIAGRLGGRVFASPHGHRTHPMSEKARGAIYNALGDVEGLRVLDAFAGSGALGIEALSRGAANALFVDNDRSAVQTIRANIKELGLSKDARVTQQNIISWSSAHLAETFDLIVADPPYDNLKVTYIEELFAHLTPTGVLVLSWPGGLEVPELDDVEQVAHKPLGDIQIVFYRKKF